MPRTLFDRDRANPIRSAVQTALSAAPTSHLPAPPPVTGESASDDKHRRRLIQLVVELDVVNKYAQSHHPTKPDLRCGKLVAALISVYRLDEYARICGAHPGVIKKLERIKERAASGKASALHSRRLSSAASAEDRVLRQLAETKWNLNMFHQGVEDLYTDIILGIGSAVGEGRARDLLPSITTLRMRRMRRARATRSGDVVARLGRGIMQPMDPQGCEYYQTTDAVAAAHDGDYALYEYAARAWAMRVYARMLDEHGYRSCPFDPYLTVDWLRTNNEHVRTMTRHLSMAQQHLEWAATRRIYRSGKAVEPSGPQGGRPVPTLMFVREGNLLAVHKYHPVYGKGERTARMTWGVMERIIKEEQARLGLSHIPPEPRRHEGVWTVDPDDHDPDHPNPQLTPAVSPDPDDHDPAPDTRTNAHGFDYSKYGQSGTAEELEELEASLMRMLPPRPEP